MSVPVLIEKRDHIGRGVLNYAGTVVYQTADTLCVESFFDRDMPSPYVHVNAGDRTVEWFYTDHWYNIFEYHDVSDDHLKGWYCNITRPSLIQHTDDGLVVAWDDLALDVFIHPDGRFLLLDEDELAELALSAEDVANVWAAVEQIRALVGQHAAPFEKIP